MNIQTLIDDHHESLREPPRSHLGCSTLGHPCDRWLWLSFRWAVVDKPKGRILRLFRRGQLEELQDIKDLQAIGCKFSDAQKRVEFGSNVSGSLDGILEGGLPDHELKRFVVEFKTHNKKSFDELEKKGVELSKLMHWVQMQVYMLGTQITQALYYATCKDDDRIYTEIVELDADKATYYVNRGKRIALSDPMPEPISSNPSWYECKFCPAWEFCHQSKLTQEVNCRTCAHATATKDNEFTCAQFDNEPMPVEWQRQGCTQHVLHPDLVPWPRTVSKVQGEAVYIIDNKEVRNGEPDAYVFSSKELIADPTACANQDDRVQEIRESFNAKIIEKSVDIDT